MDQSDEIDVLKQNEINHKSIINEQSEELKKLQNQLKNLQKYYGSTLPILESNDKPFWQQDCKSWSNRGGRGRGRHAQNFVNGGCQPQNFVKKEGNSNDSASSTSSIQSFRAKLHNDSSDSDNDSDFENTQGLVLLKSTTVSDCQSKYYL